MSHTVWVDDVKTKVIGTTRNPSSRSVFSMGEMSLAPNIGSLNVSKREELEREIGPAEQVHASMNKKMKRMMCILRKGLKWIN